MNKQEQSLNKDFMPDKEQHQFLINTFPFCTYIAPTTYNSLIDFYNNFFRFFFTRYIDRKNLFWDENWFINSIEARVNLYAIFTSYNKCVLKNQTLDTWLINTAYPLTEKLMSNKGAFTKSTYETSMDQDNSMLPPLPEIPKDTVEKISNKYDEIAFLNSAEIRKYKAGIKEAPYVH